MKGRLPKPKREPDAQEIEIWEAACRGERQVDIAYRFGTTQSAVSKVCKRVSDHLSEEFIEDIKRIRIKQTKALEHQFEECMAAWEKSKRAKRVTTRDAEGKISRRTETATGNPSHINDARSCLADIRKIWGVEAPVKTESDVEIRVAGKDRDEATRELRERLAEAQRNLEG